MKRLPHFRCIVEALDRGHSATRLALGRHLHFGYWETPESATGSCRDFAAAAERLCHEICAAARVEGGKRVLDLGCGLGGTLASINERFDRMHLQGLNIDQAQLRRAQETVRTAATNRVFFAAGDACALPFDDDSFDVAIAIESLLYTPQRTAVFRETRRVLRDEGHFVVADFLSRGLASPLLHASKLLVDRLTPAYANVDLSFTLSDYKQIAALSGFRLLRVVDITHNIRPSLPFLHGLLRSISRTRSDFIHADLNYRYGQWCVDLGMVRYAVMVLR